MELLRRQPAAFADVVNGELAGAHQPQTTKPQILTTIHLTGVIVDIVLLCQPKWRTDAVQQSDVHASPEQISSNRWF